MDIIKSKAIAPQPLRIEGAETDAVEIYLWDQNGHFIGSEWRMTKDAKELAEALAKDEVAPIG